MNKVTPVIFLLLGIIIVPISFIIQNNIIKFSVLGFSVLFLLFSIYLFAKQISKGKK